MSIEGRAETREQKAEIIGRLMTLWMEYPAMRITQLIENTRGGDNGTIGKDSCDFYYMEDFDFIRNLESFYARQRPSA